MSLICPYYEPTLSRSTPRAKQHKQKCITHMFMRKKKKHTSHMCRYTTRKAARVIFFAMQSKKIARKHFDTAKNAGMCHFFFLCSQIQIARKYFCTSTPGRPLDGVAWCACRLQSGLANCGSEAARECRRLCVCAYVMHAYYIMHIHIQ